MTMTTMTTTDLHNQQSRQSYNVTCRITGALRRGGFSSLEGDGGTSQTTGKSGRILA